MKSKVINEVKKNTYIFNQGVLVQSNQSRVILLVTGSSRASDTFSGVIISNGSHISVSALGTYSNSWEKDNFILFHGTIELTEGV